MSKTDKKTAMELLKAKKLRLRVKSEALTIALEENIEYAQENMGAILTTTVYEAIQPKVPAFLQGLTANVFNQPAPNVSPYKPQSSGLLGVAADQLIDFIPFVFKGYKGVIATFVLKKLRKLILKK